MRIEHLTPSAYADYSRTSSWSIDPNFWWNACLAFAQLWPWKYCLTSTPCGILRHHFLSCTDFCFSWSLWLLVFSSWCFVPFSHLISSKVSIIVLILWSIFLSSLTFCWPPADLNSSINLILDLFTASYLLYSCILFSSLSSMEDTWEVSFLMNELPLFWFHIWLLK